MATIRAWMCDLCGYVDRVKDKAGCPCCFSNYQKGTMVPVMVCPVSEAVQMLSANPMGANVRPEPFYVIPAPEVSA